MPDLIPFDNTQNRPRTELFYQLDQGVIQHLSKRNTKQGLSKNTRRIYRSAVTDFNAFLHENGLPVSIDALRLYFDRLKGKLKASTLNLRKSALLKCFRAQFGEDNISMNIAIEKAFQQVDSYKVDKSVPADECLTEEDVRTIIEAAQTTKTRLIIQFLYKTACRVSEMIGIRLTDCKSVNSYIKTRLIGKGNKERDVYIPTELYQAIRQEYQGRTWLFESITGKPLDANNVGRQVRKAARGAGIANYSPHRLRHARATDLLLRKGQSLKAVSKYLGHASVAITAQMYIHDQVNVDELFSRDSI